MVKTRATLPPPPVETYLPDCSLQNTVEYHRCGLESVVNTEICKAMDTWGILCAYIYIYMYMYIECEREI